MVQLASAKTGKAHAVLPRSEPAHAFEEERCTAVAHIDDMP